MRLSSDLFLCACVASLCLFGRSEVGGLALATMLTLVFLPMLYVAVNDMRENDQLTADSDMVAAHAFTPQR